MAKSNNQKLKLLYIIKILTENTDEAHPMTTKELIDALSMYGINAERKTIYDDIERLTEFGYDILSVPSKLGGGYYLGSREFELPELKLLVDAVSASRFITLKKSRELIKKLEGIAGRHDAGILQRQVYVAGRIKTENESIYYNIDSIHKAIQENRQISFVYMDYNLTKALVARDEKKRIVSPWALMWNDENYYLAAFDAENSMMKHYRVDKMGNVTILNADREGLEDFAHIDLAKYSNATFGMFGGREESVTIEFPNHMVGLVIDRFGRDAMLKRNDDNHFTVRANVVVSGQFFGWLAGIGKEARLISPKNVRDEYRAWIQEILDKT